MSPSDAPGRDGGHWFEDLADQMGPAYLRYGFTFGTAQEVGFVVDHLGLSPGSVVVDVGCGPGRHSHEFARRGHTVVGVDIARRFLEVARDTAAPSEPGAVPVAGWVRADATALPLATGCADVVVSLCQGAFGVPPVGSDDTTDAAIVAEAARVLRPGGHLVLSAFSAYFQVRWLDDTDTFDAWLGRNHEHTTIHDPDGHPHPAELWTSCYTPRELRLLVGADGFDVEAVWSVAPGDYAARRCDLEHPEWLVVARRR